MFSMVMILASWARVEDERQSAAREKKTTMGEYFMICRDLLIVGVNEESL